MTKKASKERRDVHLEITNKIVAELEQGAAPWVKPWTGNARHSGLPRNAITKRRYSGINVVVLLMAQQANGWASSEFLTFKQAQERGGNVRKGEKGTLVVFYKKLRFEETNDQGEAEVKTPMMVRGYTVFNVEQCDGLNLKGTPEPVQGVEPEELSEAFMQDVQKTGIRIEHGGARAFYTPTLDYVQMPKLADFKNAAGYMATLAHELVHATGHKSRLDRGFDKVPSKQEYAAEELVAELGAAFTCREYGIQHEELRHAGYISSWISLLKADKKAIFRAASKASKATAYLYPEASAEAHDQEEEAA